MSKTIYLIGLNGAFLHWCPGCLVRVERGDQIVARNPHGYRIELCAAPSPSWSKAPGDQFGEPGFMAAQEASHADYARAVRGRIAAWRQAIIGASDGALLRWDNERQQVVDELAEDEATFAETPLLSLPDVPEDTLDTQSGPVAVPTVGAAPDPLIPLGGDTTMSTLSGKGCFPELFGGIE